MRSLSIRTSQTHPLQIASVEAPGGGVVGLTFCPGKRQPYAATGAWDRDLDADLQAIRTWGAGVLVTLVTEAELEELGVEGLGDAVRKLGMAWLHLPLPDITAPDGDWEQAWPAARAVIDAELDRGGRVLIHCKGGLGRGGTVAARILVERGMAPDAAIRAVRRVRPGAIQTAEQERYVRALRKSVEARRAGEASIQRRGHSSALQPSPGVRTRPLPPQGSARDNGGQLPDWFERLTGFQEGGYTDTRSKLEVVGRELRSKVSGASYGVGDLELISLGELRARVASVDAPAGRLRFSNVTGDVRRLHQAPEYEGALFQVASQFNLLEMVSPSVTPEDGVARYAGDPTQGPACAIAAGAATIFRNYFVPVGDQFGQTAKLQLDGLADLGAALSEVLERPVQTLWAMRNGYALPTRDGLAAVSHHITRLDEADRDRLRCLLRIGVHCDVEVTDAAARTGQHVSQAFCSALPVAYAGLPGAGWAPFAELVLEAAYEATLLEAVMNARRGISKVVLLTRLGGGAFGNDDRWIDAALVRALRMTQAYDLDVKMVSYGSIPTAMGELENMWRAVSGSIGKGGG